MSLEQVVGLYNYWIVIFLMMTGFYIVIARQNLIKVIIGLNIFQTSVFLLYITMGKVEGGTAPIIPLHLGSEQTHDEASASPIQAIADHASAAGTAVAEHAVPTVYSNPLPSVLMLTAIVVGIATTAVALALIVRVREEYGTIEEDRILEMDRHS
jgi:multicomponent Na+:H+ antiporter subunit C